MTTLTSIGHANLFFQQANQLIGGEVSFFSGGGISLAANEFIGGARVITQASPIIIGTYGHIMVLPAWGVVPSTNSGWEVHRLFTRQQYEDAITRAVWRAARRQLQSAEEYQLPTFVNNAVFDTWGAGDSSAPDSWTLSGTSATVARETNYLYQGRNSALLGNALDQIAQLQGSVLEEHRLAGKSISIHVIAAARVGTRFRFQFYDGVTTTSSVYHSADQTGGTNDEVLSGLWHHMRLNVTVRASPQASVINLRIETGAATFAEIAKVWIEDVDAVYEVELDQRWAFLQDVFVEDGQNNFVRLPREWWYVNKDRSPRELGFIREFYLPSPSKTLKLVGQKYPADPAETDNLPIDPEYAFHRAVANLYSMLPRGVADSRGLASLASEAERQAAEWELKTATKPYPGSRSVEDV